MAKWFFGKGIIICREAGGRELIWSVFAPNKLAFQFYEGLGAKRIQELEFMSWPVPSP